MRWRGCIGAMYGRSLRSAAAMVVAALFFCNSFVAAAAKNGGGRGLTGGEGCYTNDQCTSGSCRGGHCCSESVEGDFARCADCNPAGGTMCAEITNCTGVFSPFFN